VYTDVAFEFTAMQQYWGASHQRTNRMYFFFEKVISIIKYIFFYTFPSCTLLQTKWLPKMFTKFLLIIV